MVVIPACFWRESRAVPNFSWIPACAVMTVEAQFRVIFSMKIRQKIINTDTCKNDGLHDIGGSRAHFYASLSPVPVMAVIGRSTIEDC